MTVRYKNSNSEVYRLVGGTGQGTLLGQVAYIVVNSSVANTEQSEASNKNENKTKESSVTTTTESERSDVKPEDCYKYCYDLNFLELVNLSDKLKDYNISNHIPSDIGCEQKFLDLSLLKSQFVLNQISNWTSQNKMCLNPTKSNYMIFTRSKEDFVTRLMLNDEPIKRNNSAKFADSGFQKICHGQNTAM